MPFPHVIGQAVALEALEQMIRQERVPQTLLFSGPSGCGSLAAAIDFVASLFVDADAEDPQRHADWQRVQKLIHPDLHFVFPVIGKDKISDDFIAQWRKQILSTPYFSSHSWFAQIAEEGKLGNINKRECDHILHIMGLMRYEGKRKALILWLPEYLGKEGNRLLKLLEEPTEDSLFILISENTSQILPTILSRCQVIQFNPLGDDEIAGALQQQFGLGQQQAAEIAYLSDGSFAEAIALKDQQENLQAQHFVEWMRLCYKGYGPELVQWSEQFSKLGREGQKNLLQYGLHFLRELLWILSVPGREPRLRAEEVQSARNLTRLIDIQGLKKLVTLLDAAILYVERNANARLLCLSASFEMRDILKKVSR